MIANRPSTTAPGPIEIVRSKTKPDQRRKSGDAFLHDHPSGDPKLSHEDIDMTREFKAAAEALNIAIRDHLVIGRKRYAGAWSLGLLTCCLHKGQDRLLSSVSA